MVRIYNTKGTSFSQYADFFSGDMPILASYCEIFKEKIRLKFSCGQKNTILTTQSKNFSSKSKSIKNFENVSTNFITQNVPLDTWRPRGWFFIRKLLHFLPSIENLNMAENTKNCREIWHISTFKFTFLFQNYLLHSIWKCLNRAFSKQRGTFRTI